MVDKELVVIGNQQCRSATGERLQPNRADPDIVPTSVFGYSFHDLLGIAEAKNSRFGTTKGIYDFDRKSFFSSYTVIKCAEYHTADLSAAFNQ